MKARVEIEAADLHALKATGNSLDDGRWQVYLGDYYSANTYMYITAEDARKASEAFFDLVCKLEDLDENARVEVAA